MVTERYPIVEVREELEHLVRLYETYMQHHKLEYRKGVQETIVKLPFGVLEDVLRLRLEKLAGRFFAFQKLRISLTVAELSAPGKEVAYIIRAREYFE